MKSTEAELKYAREYYQKNRSKYLERSRKRPLPVYLRLFYRARTRAQERGVPFDLMPDDIDVPTHCPVLGLPLQVNHESRGSTRSSPTLDRLVPSKGYVKGNVVVISALANRIKQDAGSEEILKVGQWLRDRGL